MQFGYALLTAQCPPSSEQSYQQVYDETIRLATIAEKNGFDAIWTSEHHFFDDGYSPSVLPLSAAIAQATEEVTIGTGIALAPLYHPIRLAEDAATVDLISGGRFKLGLANGYMDREFEVFDSPKAERAKRVVEAIELCRRAWQSGPFSFDGDIYRFDNLQVEPTPSQTGGPPIWLGGTSEAAVERAVRRADGHIGIVYYDEEMSYEGSFAEVQDNVERTAGRVDEDFTYSLMQYAHINQDRERAWEQLRPSLVYSRRKYAEHADDRDASKWNLETMSSERLEQLRAGALVGNSNDIIKQLREYEQVIPGELHIIVRMWQPLLSFEEHVSAIRLFGKEVIPEFR